MGEVSSLGHFYPTTFVEDAELVSKVLNKRYFSKAFKNTTVYYNFIYNLNSLHGGWY